jgi:hypothetical protein
MGAASLWTVLTPNLVIYRYRPQAMSAMARRCEAGIVEPIPAASAAAAKVRLSVPRPSGVVVAAARGEQTRTNSRTLLFIEVPYSLTGRIGG